MNDEEVQRLIRFKPESWKALRRIQKARGAPDSSQSTPTVCCVHASRPLI